MILRERLFEFCSSFILLELLTDVVVTLDLTLPAMLEVSTCLMLADLLVEKSVLVDRFPHQGSQGSNPGPCSY